MPNILKICLFLLILTSFGCNRETCNDGVLNGDETFIDCGGECGPCFTCSDGVKNQGETDVDCGGPCELCDDEWMVVTMSDINDRLEYVNFLTPQFGFIREFAATFFYRTLDGGLTWEKVSLPFETNFLDGSRKLPNRLFTQDSGGTLYFSDDYGDSWQESIIDNERFWVHSIDFFNSSEGVFQSSRSQNLYFYKTSDGGASFEQVYHESLPRNTYLFGQVHCPSDEEGYISTYKLFKSDDTGSTWTKIEDSPTFSSNGNVRAFSAFPTPDNGFIYGYYNSNTRGSYYTKDGGNKWEEIQPLIDRGSPFRSGFRFEKNRGFIFGLHPLNEELTLYSYGYSISPDSPQSAISLGIVSRKHIEPSFTHTKDGGIIDNCYYAITARQFVKYCE